ncbi:MAG: hypothetical protein PHR62_04870 [Paludibacter sp.]|nr:hypothetical protein [Paludibacter sp.]
MATKTFLNQDNICMIQRQYADESSYIKYMSTLWKIRAFATEMMGGFDCINKDHDAFCIWEFANQTISSLLQDGYRFNDLGECHKWGSLVEHKNLLADCETVECVVLEDN